MKFVLILFGVVLLVFSPSEAKITDDLDIIYNHVDIVNSLDTFDVVPTLEELQYMVNQMITIKANLRGCDLPRKIGSENVQIFKF